MLFLDILFWASKGSVYPFLDSLFSSVLRPGTVFISRTASFSQGIKVLAL